MRNEVKDGGNPRQAKVELALEIVTRFHDGKAANQAEDEFNARFRKGEMPADIEEKQVVIEGETIPVAGLLKKSGLVASTSDGIRMLKQGAVRIDSERVEDGAMAIRAGSSHVYQVGKRRFARVTVMKSEA